MRAPLLLALLLLALPTRADADCEARAGEIDATLARDARALHRWRWGWGIGATVAIAAQAGAAALVDDRDLRIDLVVGAVSTLGLYLGVAFPPDIELSDQPKACPERLVDAERRFRRAARTERTARSPWFHVGNGLFNVGVGLVLGLGYRHWTSGAVSAIVGFGIGEVQLFTIPHGAADTSIYVAPNGAGGTTMGLVFRF
ncbi:MAG TPA: hypothetical protein VIV40_36265 [Kofleriaceae bacterium]